VRLAPPSLADILRWQEPRLEHDPMTRTNFVDNGHQPMLPQPVGGAESRPHRSDRTSPPVVPPSRSGRLGLWAMTGDSTQGNAAYEGGSVMSLLPALTAA
jgi:hypothetical protein